MANHLTPTELASEVNMKRQEVIARCVEMGVPIFHGRIDKTLFIASLQQLSQPKQNQVA
ncbi:MAG: hypothetical protein KDB58_01065 [Solirubrobacterales bacterium]|nr:hypothetical protein [Solirubrobacterales bacterium]MCB8969257.1 hypothetical protein [Thermoleophilales bacterium]MCO5328189.1 hypothetical protein [Solirubrobacterales bacterium]